MPTTFRFHNFLENKNHCFQTVSPVSLCGANHYAALKRGIARKFRDGEGEVTCCFSNGCNLNLELAKESLEILEKPMQKEEILRIQKKADNIARLKQIELVRNANAVAGRNYQEGETSLQKF